VSKPALVNLLVLLCWRQLHDFETQLPPAPQDFPQDPQLLLSLLKLVQLLPQKFG
jgi:hypothetical protein